MNKINLELKHYCEDFSGVRKILKQIGAKREGIKNQKDYFFNLPAKRGVQPRLKLRLEGKTKTLVYYERPNFNNAGAVADVMLYDVRDKKLLPLLTQVLDVIALVEKKREVWRQANTVFHLDTVKGVGQIFEIELQKKGKLTEKDKRIFKTYQNAIKPYLGKVIQGSNVDLVKKIS